jgi:hypothetical protein
MRSADGFSTEQVKVFAPARDFPSSQNLQTDFVSAVMTAAKTGEHISFVCVGILDFSQPEFFSHRKSGWRLNL